MNTLILVFGLLLGTIVLAVAATVLFYMWTGLIDLKYLISEEDGSASISRLQLLIFTFVLALGYFLLILCQVSHGGGAADTLKLPDIPTGVQALLGISGGSYVLSKGIQKTAEVASKSSSQSKAEGSTS